MIDPIIVVCDNPDMIREALEMERVVQEQLRERTPVSIIAHTHPSGLPLTAAIMEILGVEDNLDDLEIRSPEILVVDDYEGIEKLAISRMNEMVLKMTDMIEPICEPFIGWDRTKDWEQRERRRPRRKKRRK